MTKPLYKREPRTESEARAFLKKRYEEQCDRYPSTRRIPLSLYVASNLRGAMRGPWKEIEQ